MIMESIRPLDFSRQIAVRMRALNGKVFVEVGHVSTNGHFAVSGGD